MADVDCVSDPYVNPDGSITWLVHYANGTNYWFKWDPKVPPQNSMTVKKVDVSHAGHGTILPGPSSVEVIVLPDGSKATLMGNENGPPAVDWIHIHRPEDHFTWR